MVLATATAPSMKQLLDSASSKSMSDIEMVVELHDAVRERVLFGFTPYLDSASPDTTLRLGVGLCNPQAALMVELFHRAGFEARFQPVTVANDVFHGLAITPRLLSHVFSEVKVDRHWCRLDSYIVDPVLRRAAIPRLRSEGRELGYGCHVNAAHWDGHTDAFSQIATPDLIVEEHPPVTSLKDFYRSPNYRRTTAGARLASWLTPLRAVSRSVSKLANRPIEALRQSARRRGSPSPADRKPSAFNRPSN